ncbi:MAG: T9SS type A sorting domain-containing protein [Bacteroidota bacterium]
MKRTAILFSGLFFIQSIMAQWSTNPSVNNQISSGNDGAALPYISTHGSGVSYFSWFAPVSTTGEYMPWIQKLDYHGNALWSSPVQISSHQSMTWITDYSLEVTPDTCALIAFQDMRTGNNDVFIYKIGANGEFLWGSDGIQLSTVVGFNVDPVMAVHPDGNVVVAWPLPPDIAKGQIFMQRLNAAGDKLWGTGIVLSDTAYDYTWPRIIPVENGNSILVCYKEDGPYWAPNRKMIAQKFGPDGTAVWPADALLFDGVMPGYVLPVIASDGVGGVYVTWMHEPTFSRLSSKIQHVDGNGVVTMPANGVECNTNPSAMSLEPALGVDILDHSAYVFWRESNLLQTQFGLGGQRVTMDGTKKWGDYGKTFEPIGSTFSSLMKVSGINGGAILGYLDDYNGSSAEDRVIARRIDSTGVEPWSGTTRIVASTPAGRGHLAKSPLNSGQIIYAWEDNKAGETQIWAQNLTESGNFGPIDDSFSITHDTLWFLTGEDFIWGKQFYIINPHDYSLDIQHLDQFGIPCQNCIPWYTEPTYPVFPVSVPANDSIPILVKFFAIDFPTTTFVYDTLIVNTIGHTGHVIIAADSNMILIGVAEPGIEKIIAAPNPFTEKVRIFLGTNRETFANVTIYNSLMQPVRELFTGIVSQNNSLIWDGTDRYGREVSRGIYFITIITPSGQKTLKIVKM